MNTQDKDVVITNFSICGVDGFKTVHAVGASVEKRMHSAFNQIERMLKDEEKELTRNYDIYVKGNSPQADVTGAGLGRVRRALKLVSTIKNTLPQEQDKKPFVKTNVVKTLTTEEFFNDSLTAWINIENHTHFFEKLEEIDVGIDKYLAETPQVPAPTFTNHEAILCICTGSFFGNKPFFLFTTPHDVQENSNGDLGDSAREFCFRSLRMLKNMKLTDYLRLDGGRKERVKNEIIKIDNFIDMVREVLVVNGGSVMSKVAVKVSSNKSLLERYRKTSILLKTEAELRLIDYFGSLISDNEVQPSDLPVK